MRPHVEPDSQGATQVETGTTPNKYQVSSIKHPLVEALELHPRTLLGLADPLLPPSCANASGRGKKTERERENSTPFQPHRADAGAATTSPGRSYNQIQIHLSICRTQHQKSWKHQVGNRQEHCSGDIHVNPKRSSSNPGQQLETIVATSDEEQITGNDEAPSGRGS